MCFHMSLGPFLYHRKGIKMAAENDVRTTQIPEEQQQGHFDMMNGAIGCDALALFCCCMAYDVPFFPDAVPKSNTEDFWMAYRKRLRAKKLDKAGTLGFKDGITDATKLFGEEVPAEEVTLIVQQDRKMNIGEGAIPTKSQVNDWGKGSEQWPLTKDDYDRLDYFYDTLTSRLVSAGGVDTQQELILRKVSELYWEEEKYRAEGNINDAQKCVKMALDLLSSEQLQKKDAKPVEDVRVDSIVDALEKWGAVEDGKILSFPDLTEFLLKQLGRLGGTPAHKYSQTLDAADYELWFIRNCMAQNEDLPKIEELPDNMRFPEEVANEFSAEPSDDEKRAYEGIGIVRSRQKKRGRKKKE